MRYLVCTLLVAGASSLAAQVSDEGTFSIRKSGREIGREEFVIQGSRPGGAQGTTIVSRVRVPVTAPQLTQESILERRTDGSFAAMQITHQASRDSSRVLAEAARNVLRIHRASSGSEGVREYPAASYLVGLADSAFALFAAATDLATDDGRLLAGVFPLSGRQVTFTARRVRGDASNGTRILLAGEIAGTLWVDDSGHLTRMEFPGSGIEIVRLRR